MNYFDPSGCDDDYKGYAEDGSDDSLIDFEDDERQAIDDLQTLYKAAETALYSNDNNDTMINMAIMKDAHENALAIRKAAIDRMGAKSSSSKSSSNDRQTGNTMVGDATSNADKALGICGIAGTVIVADDATVAGVGDDLLLIVVGVAAYLAKGGNQNVRDSGLVNVPDSEVSRLARDKSLPSSVRQ